MSEIPRRKRLRLIGKDRERELRSAIVDWGLRGMSKSQSKLMAALFNETTNSSPLDGDEFAEAFKGAWAEVRQIEREEHFKDLADFETLPVEYLMEPLVPIG